MRVQISLKNGKSEFQTSRENIIFGARRKPTMVVKAPFS